MFFALVVYNYTCFFVLHYDANEYNSINNNNNNNNNNNVLDFHCVRVTIMYVKFLLS